VRQGSCLLRPVWVHYSAALQKQKSRRVDDADFKLCPSGGMIVHTGSAIFGAWSTAAGTRTRGPADVSESAHTASKDGTWHPYKDRLN
jgi:hypothetical protein